MVETIEVEVAPGNDRAFRFWQTLGFESHGGEAKGAHRLHLHKQDWASDR